MAKGSRDRGLVTLGIALLLLLSTYSIFQLLLIWVTNILEGFGITSEIGVYTTILVFTVVVLILVGYGFRGVIKKIIGR